MKHQLMRKEPLTKAELGKLILKEYHEFLNVFDPVKAKELPPKRAIDHTIDLKVNATPPFKKAYSLSQEQAIVVRECINEILGKGFIRASRSPYAAPILIVKKPDGGLRIYIDYCALNALTRKNRNAPPLIRETLSRLCLAKDYTKLDIIAAFNEIRKAEGHEDKTAFLTRYGLFEYAVMPFGLCNAPATFQAYINSVLQEFLDQFCTAYLDDILIYSNSLTEHIDHVSAVLRKVQGAGLYLDIKKCSFHTKEVRYLG